MGLQDQMLGAVAAEAAKKSAEHFAEAGIKGMIDKGDTKQFATRKKIGSMR